MLTNPIFFFPRIFRIHFTSYFSSSTFWRLRGFTSVGCSVGWNRGGSKKHHLRIPPRKILWEEKKKKVSGQKFTGPVRVRRIQLSSVFCTSKRLATDVNIWAFSYFMPVCRSLWTSWLSLIKTWSRWAPLCYLFWSHPRQSLWPRKYVFHDKGRKKKNRKRKRSQSFQNVLFLYTEWITPNIYVTYGSQRTTKIKRSTFWSK